MKALVTKMISMSGKLLCFCSVMHEDFDPHIEITLCFLGGLTVSGAGRKEFPFMLQHQGTQMKVLRVEFRWERLHCHCK